MNPAILASNKKQGRGKFDFTNFLILFSILFIITRVIFWGTYKVEGHSMDPTLKGGNYLVAINYFTPERGDLVTAKEDDRIIIKRVIGLPNDTIEFKNDKLLKKHLVKIDFMKYILTTKIIKQELLKWHILLLIMRAKVNLRLL